MDGDTFDAEIDLGFHVVITKRARMLGYNAPEIFGGHFKSKEEKDLGLEIKKSLEAVLSSGSAIVKTKLDETDKYGRILTDVFVEGKHVNDELKALSLAAWEKLKSLYPGIYK